ncbi:MAG TPA: response regulator [Mariprofundaceae bacterium]|nr:response regulator [Mariprofundaceae bacterium]
MFHFVDDNTDFLEFVEVFTPLNGYTCLTFDSPLKYLEYSGSADYRKPVALFTDIRMPQLNGYEMLARLHERHPGIRMAVISGYADEPGEKHYCLYLPKPVRPEMLLKALNLFMRCEKEGPADLQFGCHGVDDDSFKMNCRNCPAIIGKREDN